jgi:hypothetical protein
MPTAIKTAPQCSLFGFHTKNPIQFHEPFPLRLSHHHSQCHQLTEN